MSRLQLDSLGTRRADGESVPMIGRKRELVALRRLFASNSIVTLTGPAGVGKTRLAWQWATERIDAGETVHWWRPDDLIGDCPPDTVAVVVDEGHTGAVLLAQRVRDVLSERPDLLVLCTSWRPLGMEGEAVLQLRPLDVDPSPDAGHVPSALALFHQRAQTSDHRFELNSANEDVVRDICALAGGLPAVIEFAASRVRGVSLDHIRALLADGLLDLPFPGFGHPPQTVRQRLADTYAGLDEPARRIWRRAVLFDGDITPRALAVVAELDMHGRAFESTELVLRLVDEGVLRTDGATYRMDVGAREWGREALDADERAAAIRLLAGHYLDLAAGANREWMSPTQRIWFRRVDEEVDTIETLLPLLGSDAPGRQTCLQMVSELRHYWVASQQFGRARTWIRQLMLPGDAPSAAAASALRDYAYFGIYLDAADVAGDLARSREMALLSGGDAGHPYYALVEGLLAMQSGRTDDAERYCRQALKAFESPTSEYLRGDAIELHFYLTIAISSDPDRLREAEGVARRGLAIASELGAIWGRSLVMFTLAFVAWRAGDAERSTEIVHETLRLLREVDDRGGTALCLEQLARIDADKGDFGRAMQLLAPVYETQLATRTLFSEVVGDLRDLLREQVGEERFVPAFHRAATLPTEQAVQLALEEALDLRAAETPDVVSLLSERELEVAALVAQGYSNSRIAGHLVLSPRTVEGHVLRIMRKCGFSSRTQIGVWYVDMSRSQLAAK